MNFLNPWNFAWLLPLAGGIIAFWILRMRRIDTPVSSLHLWRSLIDEAQATVPFQRLRRSLLLILQLLAAFLLIFTLAHPILFRHGHSSRTIIVIVDNSASMSATDVKPTRLAAAKAAASRLIAESMDDGDVAAVIAASHDVQLEMPITPDRFRVQDAIDSLAPTDTPGDLPQALSLALSLARDKPGSMIRVITDGVAPSEYAARMAALPYGNVDVQTVLVGAGVGANTAITALGARRDPVTGAREIYVDVRGFGAHPRGSVGLSLLKDGKLIDARDMALPGGEQSEVFTGPRLNDAGTYTVRLDGLADDLAADNSASLVLPQARERKVLLVTKGNVFLEHGLGLDKDVVLDEADPTDFATVAHGGAGYALVIFDGWLPPHPLPPGNYLVLNAAGPGTPFESAGKNVDSPALVDQDTSHPVMRFVDLQGLLLRRGRAYTLAPWARSVADSASAPLIAAGENNGARFVSVGFDLSDSNWPLRVSFPIFLTNAVDWLTTTNGVGPTQDYTPAGEIASVHVPAGLRSVGVTRPDGSFIAVDSPPAGGVVSFGGTNHTGIYQVKGPAGFHSDVAVNLLNRDASAINPREPLIVAHKGVAAPKSSAIASAKTKTDLTPLIAALALVLLLAEWAVYHRRAG